MRLLRHRGTCSPQWCVGGGVGGAGLTGGVCRVDITFLESTLVPEQLQTVFGAQVPLLLSVFNPQGWCVAARDVTWRLG